ncbi:MAG: FecR domain-containing protein [Gammaproteobacteria bacterium]|nr:FecR domain-containing protein [Gammaproteobacteria bacterium]
MNDFDQGTSVPSDDALEQLLKRAVPRLTPSKSDEAAVRQAVRAEWRRVSSTRQSHRRVLNYAMAATVLIGVFALFSVFRTSPIETVQVATIEKSFGSIYLLGEESELRETVDLSSVRSAQTIVTGAGAGMALAWVSGGSLRVDENTRVEFTTDNSVYLKSGRLYFDSEPSAMFAGTKASESDGFVVNTDYGEIAHIGTQFMTRVDTGELTVSVREGQVDVDGTYHRHVATSGQQVTFFGRQQPAVLNLSAHAKEWNWVGRTSPPADVDGKPIHEFLKWVHRETGLETRFEGQAEQVARNELLKGTMIDAEPLDALQRWMATTALEYDVNESEGVIYVRDNR